MTLKAYLVVLLVNISEMMWKTELSQLNLCGASASPQVPLSSSTSTCRPLLPPLARGSVRGEEDGGAHGRGRPGGPRVPGSLEGRDGRGRGVKRVKDGS